MSEPPPESPSSPIGPFHVHPDHAFEGFAITELPEGRTVLVARCSCGVVLDSAEAVFKPCPRCSGGDPDPTCGRCGGAGEVIDHGALVWRAEPLRE